MFKFDFKKRRSFRFFLKSGQSFTIRAVDLKITFNTVTSEITGYEFDGIRGAYPRHININQIAAVVRL